MFTMSVIIPDTERRYFILYRLSDKPGVSKVTTRGNRLYITYDPVKAPPVLIHRWINENYGLILGAA